MNWKEPYIRDIASEYPSIRAVLSLSPKMFVDILEEKLSEKFSPFIKVVIQERTDILQSYYSVYVKFYYKGMHYQSCCTTQELDTDTVVHVFGSLSREIKQCMEERD